MDQASQYREVENFDVRVTADVFEKGSGPDRVRIGGVITTDTKDRQNESILQDGLVFDEFLEHGWLNDNHGNDAKDVAGYPTSVRMVRKGQMLPSGKRATANGHYMEGWLVPANAGRTYIDLARALDGTPRKIGFSVQGKIVERGGPDGKIIRKARVRHVAVTHVPVNTDTGLDLLAKALTATGGPSGPTPADPPRRVAVTGEGAGKVITPESLEHDDEKDKDKDGLKKGLTLREASLYLRGRGLSPENAAAVIAYTVARTGATTPIGAQQ